ncbi:MAG: hypothetical protein IJP37_02365 [Clostridia bacterium]|nr:hypothetical protein [Clostridia bacterium]
MKKRKFVLWMLVAAILVGCLPFGAAMAEDTAPNITVTVQPLVEYSGTATASFIITNNSDQEITITHVIPQPNDSKITGVKTPMKAMTIAPGASEAASCDLNIASDVSAGIHGVNLSVYAAGYEKSVPAQFVLYKTTVTAPEAAPESPAPEQGENLKALVLDSTDLAGQIIPAPSGDAGDRIEIRLPIKNRGARSFAEMTNVVSGAEITPVLSSNPDAFPFVIEELDYKRSLPVMAPGAKAEVVYDLKLSPNATSGVKEVKFNAVYYVDGVAETTSFSVFVTVVKGAAAPTGPDGEAAVTSVPKVIIKSYKTDPETLMAGESFKLTMDLMNTSDKESVKNLKVTVSNSDGVILPAGGASNTLYVKSIGKEDVVQVEIDLQSAPDISAKSHSLAVQFDYEGGTTLNAYKDTADLSLPVSQPIRIKIDEPVIYGDGNLPEQPVSIGFAMFNMGKTAIYNCMVDVEGEGLKMEESYFGGNVASGSTMRADFNIIPSVAGTIEGNILVTYEDVYGTEYVEKLPITINVMELFVPDEPMIEDPNFGGDIEVYEPDIVEKELLPWWGWALIALVVVIVVIIVLSRVRKARRRRAIEED